MQYAQEVYNETNPIPIYFLDIMWAAFEDAGRYYPDIDEPRLIRDLQNQPPFWKWDPEYVKERIKIVDTDVLYREYIRDFRRRHHH